jgi:hypothetical protein
MLSQIQNSSKKPVHHCWSNIGIYFRYLSWTTPKLTLFLFAGTLRNWAYCCCFGRTSSLKIQDQVWPWRRDQTLLFSETSATHTNKDRCYQSKNRLKTFIADFHSR